MPKRVSKRLTGLEPSRQQIKKGTSLIPRSALFTPEQLTEVYRCIHETLESRYPITDKQQKCLQSIISQIEYSIPNLGELLNQEQELEASESPENGGMQFS